VPVGDVVFDYDGALQLAGALWRLADDVDALADSRGCAALDATETWEGRYAAMFDLASDDANIRARGIATGLRLDAEAAAAAWARAMDDQNQINYGRAYASYRREVEQSAGFVATLQLIVSPPRIPAPVTVPTAPSFAATAELARF
jgi:hypothetical protein